ncbi:MAG TPA: DegT/DnrJ/EryC1/StrS family aminotransferase [Candidatus Nitrosotenuis sp.]|jgi:dTDP-4-amino-4,6-dideoxygalactose transaminase|nr:DegT/DnrJ/EryC1/StrS family aminotransferase [Candidatus Nitrosotenuis sp.]
MKVPVNLPFLSKEEIAEAAKVLRSGTLTTAANLGGKNVQEFERLVCRFIKSRYAVAVNSGTAALQAALYAAGIKHGDEVLIPSFTFVATANAVVSVGAKPIFVDILKDNYTMDPADLKRKITKKSRAVIPVHLYGNVAYIDEISEIAKRSNLDIIEDAAQSMGSTYKKRQTGTFSELGCFSLYAAKVMTSGEGGVVVTNSKDVRDKLLMIRNHGMIHGYDTRVLGLNLRLPEVNAAIAKVQMKKLPKFLQLRQKNAKILTELLAGLDLVLPRQRKHEKVNWYLYTVASTSRDKILKELNAKGIGATVYYSTPVHRTPFYNKRISLPVTEWAARSVLSLPVQPMVTQKQLELTAKVIHSVLA